MSHGLLTEAEEAFEEQEDPRIMELEKAKMALEDKIVDLLEQNRLLIEQIENSKYQEKLKHEEAQNKLSVQAEEFKR